MAVRRAADRNFREAVRNLKAAAPYWLMVVAHNHAAARTHSVVYCGRPEAERSRSVVRTREAVRLRHRAASLPSRRDASTYPPARSHKLRLQ